MNELNLFGVIGEEHLTAASVKAALSAFDPELPLTVRIDSPGGSVFAGNAIHSAIKEYPGPKKAIVESYAGSIASYILTAFDDVEITTNGFVMIHNPSMSAEGDDDDLARGAKLLSDIKEHMVEAYSDRMKKPSEKVRQMMKEETHFTATEALEAGLCTQILEGAKASSIPVAFTESLPYSVVASLRSGGRSGDDELKDDDHMAEKVEPVAATVGEIQAAFPKMKSDFVLECVKRSLPMASVAAEAAAELLAENESLKEQMAAMTEEIESYKAKAMEEEEAKAMEEKEEAEAKNQAKAHSPVENVTGGNAQSATVAWKDAVAKYSDRSRPEAVRLANRNNPGLREKMLEEVNAR